MNTVSNKHIGMCFIWRQSNVYWHTSNNNIIIIIIIIIIIVSDDYDDDPWLVQNFRNWINTMKPLYHFN
jgi:hypothetical protein